MGATKKETLWVTQEVLLVGDSPDPPLTTEGSYAECARSSALIGLAHCELQRASSRPPRFVSRNQ